MLADAGRLSPSSQPPPIVVEAHFGEQRTTAPEPAGPFEPHRGSAAIPIEASIEDADALAVTVEPSLDSSVPTGEPLLTVTL